MSGNQPCREAMTNAKLRESVESIISNGSRNLNEVVDNIIYLFRPHIFVKEVSEALDRSPPIPYDAAVEKVARAIAYSEYKHYWPKGVSLDEFEIKTDTGKSMYRNQAKAALAAMGISEGK